MRDDVLHRFVRVLARKLPAEIETIRAAWHEALDDALDDDLEPKPRRAPVRHPAPRPPPVATPKGDLLTDDAARAIARRRLKSG